MAVPRDAKAFGSNALRDDDGERGQTGLQRARVLHGDGLAIRPPVATREGGGLVELAPRPREQSGLLMAERQVQDRAAARIQTLALLELRAGQRDLSSGQQSSPFLEQHGRQRLVVGAGFGPGAPGRAQPDQQNHRQNRRRGAAECCRRAGQESHTRMFFGLRGHVKRGP